MGSDKTHVGVRLPEAQKERWEEAQEQSGFGSMSQFVKNAVESHIADSDGDTDGSQTLQDTEAFGKVLDKLDGLSGDVSRLEQTVEEATAEESGASYDFDRVLLELLPTPPDGEPVAGKDVKRTGNQLEFGKWAVTPEGLASRIGGDKKAVADRLAKLEDRVTAVRFVTDGDERLYFKESDY